MRRLAIVVCGAVLAAGCAQESSTPPSPGCMMATAGTCLVGAGATEAACAAQGGTWQGSGCPGEGQLGTCATTAGGLVVYYGPLWTSATARSICAGTWAPVPAPPSPPAASGTITMSCTDPGLLCIDATGVFSDAGYADFRASCSGTLAQAPCALSNAVAGHCQLTSTAPGYDGLAVRLYLSATYFTPTSAASTCASESNATTTATWVP